MPHLWSVIEFPLWKEFETPNDFQQSTISCARRYFAAVGGA